MKVLKRILGRAADRGEDPYLAMLAYRSSPLDCGTSPSELLFGRKIRSRLPYRCETYIAKSPPHDRGISLMALQPNDTVRVKDPRRGRWPVRAKVVRMSGPRSYDVLSEDGRLMRRNRQHLMSTRETFTSSPADFSGVSHNAERDGFKCSTVRDGNCCRASLDDVIATRGNTFGASSESSRAT